MPQRNIAPMTVDTLLEDIRDAEPERLHPRGRGQQLGPAISIRIPEGLERALDVAVQRSREAGLPWQTRTDLCRDAIAWFTELVLSRIENGDAYFESLQLASGLNDRLTWMTDAQTGAQYAAKRLFELLVKLMASSEFAAGRREILEARRTIGRMTDPYMKRQYLDALEGNKQLQGMIRAFENEEAADEQEALEEGSGRSRERTDLALRGAPRLGELALHGDTA